MAIFLLSMNMRLPITALGGLTQTMGALFTFSLLSLGGALLLHPRMVTHQSQAARGAVHFWHGYYAGQLVDRGDGDFNRHGRRNEL